MFLGARDQWSSDRSGVQGTRGGVYIKKPLLMLLNSYMYVSDQYVDRFKVAAII